MPVSKPALKRFGQEYKKSKVILSYNVHLRLFLGYVRDITGFFG